MKVLFVCPFVPWPLVNGGKIRTYHLIKEVSAHAEVHLRVIREPDDVPDAHDALSPWCASLEFFDRARPSTIARWTRPKLERWFHSPGLHAAVRQDVSAGNYQLVHLDELLLARILPPGRSVPLIQHHHKLDTVLYHSLSKDQGPTRYFDLWKLRRLEAESARRYRHHLLCSQGDADVLRARYGALDCNFVPSGFDADYFQLGKTPPARATNRLVFLGSMDYGPNVDGVLNFASESLPAIRAQRPDLEFHIVGRNPAPEIQALANEHIIVHGSVDDVRPHLGSASLFIVPLRIGGGTRLKVVEALAMATPTVSTTIGAEGLGLQSGEHIAMADGDDAFAQTCLELLDTPDRARAMGERGRAFVQSRYHWKALGAELAEHWEHVAFNGALSASR